MGELSMSVDYSEGSSSKALAWRQHISLREFLLRALEDKIKASSSIEVGKIT
jgi:hypothetical protein